MDKPGEWYHRPKAVKDPAKTLWYCYYPHRLDGKDMSGIAVVVDKEPADAQLLSAQGRFTEYAREKTLL